MTETTPRETAGQDPGTSRDPSAGPEAESEPGPEAEPEAEPGPEAESESGDVLGEHPREVWVVNNYPFYYPTDRVGRLHTLLQTLAPSIEVRRYHYQGLPEHLTPRCAALVLTGSIHNVTDFRWNEALREAFSREVALVHEAGSRPVLGICFGHQLLAHAFGGEVRRMRIPSPGNQIITIFLRRPDELIPREQLPVNIFHRDYVPPADPAVQAEFEIVSTKTLFEYETVQYMRHKHRPVYSIQFHPETHWGDYHFGPQYEINLIQATRESGEALLRNFLVLCDLPVTPESRST